MIAQTPRGHSGEKQKPVSGRKPKRESRSEEFRQTLAEGQQAPAAFRPSLRTPARELGTTHQLLSHYLATLEEWRREKDLEEFRAKAKAKNIFLTPEIEERYLAWLRRIEERQARDAARAAKWSNRHAALLNRLKHLLPDSSRSSES
jgi:hypothetical protein